MSVDWFVHGFETDTYAKELSDAIVATGNKVQLLQLPPFSAELPDPPTEPFVLYGGTRIIEAAAVTPGWDQGVWYNKQATWWINQSRWGPANMLMPVWYLTCFDWLDELEGFYSKTDRVFVRPDSDLKEFAGEVMTFGALREWAERLMSIADEPGLTLKPTDYIIVGDVIEIAREWRVFIVDGKPVSCSRYRSYGKLDKALEFPVPVWNFIKTVSNIYLPAPVIVIDVGVTPEHRYGVIEANCFNSSGWYNADIETVVAAVSDYVVGKKG